MNTNIEVLRELDELVEAARLLGATQAKKLFGEHTEGDRRFERAMYESIDKHRAALLDWEAKQPAPQQPAAVDEAKETDLWRCTVCGQVSTVGRCCGEETREPWRPIRRKDEEETMRIELEAEVEALRAEVAEWKRVAAAQAELHGEAEARAERLAEALRLAEEHINALTPEWYSAGQRVLAEIRAALREQEDRNE